jgi:hypothetical protein
VTGKTKPVRGLRVLQCVFDSILANKRNDSGDRGGDRGKKGEKLEDLGAFAPSSVGVGRERFEY